MRRHGEEGEHPDEEEVVGDQGVHLGKANALDAYPLEELGVAVAVEDLPSDGGRAAAELGYYDGQGETNGQEGRDHEGEQDLEGKVRLVSKASLSGYATQRSVC